MKNRILMVMLALAVLFAAAFAVSAANQGATEPNEIYSQELDFSNGGNPVCPWCGAQPENGWIPLDSDISGDTMELNGHYYLTGDRNNTTDYACWEYDACVYIGDYNITATGSGAFQLDGGKTLTIMGRGNVTGSHSQHASVGGTIDIGGNGGTLNLCGGTYTKSSKDTGCAVLTVRSAVESTVNMYAGTVIENGDANNYEGGNVRIVTPATFNMYGGTISGGKAYCGGNVALLHADAKFNMYGGAIEGGFAELSDGSLYMKDEDGNEYYAQGGNVYAPKGQFIQEKGAAIRGGNAYTGGNIYYKGGQTITLGGTVTGGTGFTAGNIDLRGSSTLILPEGAQISHGRADYDGGNIQVFQATLELRGGNITGGQAGRWGGNILADNGAQVNMTGGTITGGEVTNTQTSCGGNLYVGDAHLTVSGGKITMGKAVVRGGNIHFEKTPYTVSIDHCEISYGQASAGGNICVLGADIPEGVTQSPTLIQLGKDALITEGASLWVRDESIAGGGGNIFIRRGIMNIYGQVSSGTADTTGGNLEVRGALVQLLGSATVSGGQADYDGGNIAVSNVIQSGGQLVLDGSSAVTGGTAGRYGDNIFTEGWTGLLGSATVTDHGGLYLGSNASLRIYEGFVGNVALSNLDLPENILGLQLSKRFVSESDFTGRLWLAELADAPYLFGKDGGLVVGSAYTVKNGAKTWFADNASAIAAYGDADFLVPYGDLVLTGGTYVVDLAGQNLTISGAGRVTCFDSSNDTYKTYGGLTMNGPVLQNKLAQSVNGKYYVRVRKSGVYSFHRMDLKVSDVSLRISSGGIYYSARWQCDDMVRPLIQGFGVGVSIADMPTENLRFDSDTKHTFHSPSEFVSGIKTNGVLISDILRDSATAGQDRVDKNSAYGKLPIYAKAYVILDNGVDREQTLISDDHIAFSLHDVLESIQQNMPHYYSAAQSLQNFKTHWAQNGLAGSEWDFDFTVPVEIVELQQRFDSAQALTGQIHDRLEETADLSAWKSQMEASGIDFAACLESETVSYMGSSSWDSKNFLGGLEATFTVDGKSVDCDLLFATKTAMEAVLKQSGAFTYANNAFTTKALTEESFVSLINYVQAQGGVFALAHPKQIGLIESQDPMDYWFADGMALDIGTSEQNYKLWTDLLSENKRVYAISANAGALTGKADGLNLYTTQKNAQAILAELAAGNYTCGSVGMQMVLGDALMGQSCDFSGKKLAIGVDQAADGVLQAGHTYRIDLITKSGIKASWPYTGRAVYELVEADATQAFYRLEIVDETTAERIAVGNPIWNDDYGLKVGFARKDITPEYTVLIVGGEQRYGNTRKASDDGIFLTCVAVQEGDQTLLVYTADFINADDSYVLPLKRAVAEATGVPVENMLFNTTHTHSSVGINYSDWSFIGSEGAKNRKTFLEDVNNAAVAVAQSALNDLTAVDGLYAGSVTGKKNVAFVRHYIKRDGTLDYSNTGKYDDDIYSWKRQYKAHAAEADNEIQLVKFSRGDGKLPVVLMSVPAHATLNENSEYLSADFPVYARTYIEDKTDCLVAYFIGAAGDQVPRSKLRSNYLLSTLGVENNTDAKKYGTMLGDYAVTALKKGLTQLSNTSLKLTTSIYEGTIQPDTETRYNDAKALLDSYNAGTDVTNALKIKGFVEMSEVNAVVRRYEYVAKNGNIMPVEIKNMAIGDLGFVFAPYEMSGANGKQIKQSSPYANTFIVTCADDGYGYMASQDAYNHHSYEAWSSWLAAGSGELLAKRYVQVLEQMKFHLQ